MVVERAARLRNEAATGVSRPEDASADSLMVVERAARLRNEAATGVSRPEDASADSLMVVDRRVETRGRVGPDSREPPSRTVRGFVAGGAQALGRLPWFAPFFLRARRLRPVLPMGFLLIGTSLARQGQRTVSQTPAAEANSPSRHLERLRPSASGSHLWCLDEERPARHRRFRKRSASTTTRVISPVATTLPGPVEATLRAATVKRCRRPSTYDADAVTSTS